MKTKTREIRILERFNLRFLAELEGISPELLHLATGSRRHPLLRTALLRNCRDDIQIDGLQAAVNKWRRFIGVYEPVDLGLRAKPPVLRPRGSQLRTMEELE